MYFPQDEYEGRWERVYAEMEQRGLETCVVWQRSGGGFDRAGGVQWLCNYGASASGQESNNEEGGHVGRGFAALVFHARQTPELHVIEPEDTIPAGQLAQVDIQEHEFNLPTGLGQRLVGLGVEGTVGYVGNDFLPVRLYEDLQAAAPGITWQPADDLLFGPQNIKSPRELDAYREAGEISSRALTAMMEALIAGEAESAAAARAASVVIGAGGGFQRIGINHGPSMETSPWSNSFYGFGTDSPTQGDLVRAFVYGPIYQGYWIDPGRTAVCGNSPTPDQRELLETGARLTEDIMSYVRAGVSAREIARIGDKLWSEVIHGETQKSQIHPIYGHGLGHSWMPPMFLSERGGPVKDSPIDRLDAPIQVGQVCTVETFVTREGIGTSIFEQVFIIQEDGIELVTDTPMLFW